ncbi:MAG: sugar ABC transporter permease [Candidatus Caccosoma sp.]|nr:sugar ABC transporter permease [Candidatus Caccosoma sp.]
MTKKVHLKKDTKDLIFVILLVALPLLQFFIFYVCVNINSILLAFKKYDINNNVSFAGFDNFKQLFIDFKSFTLYKVALKNSTLVFLIGCPISLTLALLFSYYIYKKNSKFANIFKIVLFLPSVIPAIALATMFVQITDSAYPKLMQLLFNKEVFGLLQNPKSTIGTIIFYNIWCSFGVNMLLLISAMSSINPSMIEAAKIDGVSFFQEFIYITFPQIFGTIKTLLIVSVGGFFVNSASIVSFYGTTADESVYTIGYYIYKETVNLSLNNSQVGVPKLAAFGILLTVITLPIVYLLRYVLERFGPKTN